MIQFNLLPDVKIEYIKARQTKRLVVMISSVVAGISVAVMAVLFTGTNLLQKRHLSNLSKDIDSYSQQLKNQEGLDKILTVQNQLGALDELHSKKPAAARVGKYLSQIVPADVTISQFSMNFADNTMAFDGTAASLASVNKFIDTLKFTNFKTDGNEQQAFSSVVLASFGRSDDSSTGQENPATYQVTLSFDPAIFDINKEVELVVPKTTSTRSSIESQASPFESSGASGQGGQ